MKRLILIPVGACIAIIFVLGCPFKWITGIPCPGCGMTHAFLAAAQFDFANAFLYHPLFPLVLLCFLIVAIQAVRYIASSHRRIRDLGYEDIHTMLSSLVEPLAGRIAIAVVIAAFFVLYLLRLYVTLSGIGGVLDFRILF
jgi:uncharacterized membrane protein